MPRIIDNKTTQRSVAGTTIVVGLPPHAIDDVLLIWVAIKGASPGTLTVTSGWTINTQQLGQGSRGRMAFIFKKATTASEANPTVTSATSSTWAATAMTVRGVDTTTAIDATTTTSTSASNLPTSPTITTANSNSLVVYGICCDSAQWWTPWDNSPVGGVQQLALSSSEFEQSGYTNVSTAVAWSLKKTAGASLAAKWIARNQNYNNGLMTLALRDAATGQVPGYQDPAVETSRVIDPIPGINRPLGGDWVTATTVATTIGGKTVVAYPYPGGGDYQNFGVHPYLIARRMQYGTNANMVISPVDLVTNSGASCDATWGNGTFLMSMIPTTPAQAYLDGTVAEAGLTLLIWDTTATPRWRAWTIGGSDSNPGLAYGRVKYLVQADHTTSQLDASGTAPTLTAIEGYGIGATNVNGNYFDIMVNQLHLLNKVTLVGGSSSRPAVFEELLGAMRSTAFEYYDRAGSSAILSYIALELGGSLASFIAINGAAITFVGTADSTRGIVNTHIAANKLGINFNPVSGDSIAFTNSTISSTNAWYLTISSGAANVLSWLGSTFIGAGTVTLRAITLSSFTLNKCGTPTLNSAALDKVTISESSATTALTVASTAQIASMTNMTFINNTLGHSITITTAGTYTFNNYVFTGGGADASTTADVYNNSGGSVTINITGGGGTPTIRDGTGASTSVVNSVTVTVTALDEAGAPIQNARVLLEVTAGGADILTGLTNASGVATASYSGSVPVAVSGWVRKSSAAPFYKQATLAGNVTSGGYSATVTMVSDD